MYNMLMNSYTIPDSDLLLVAHDADVTDKNVSGLKGKAKQYNVLKLRDLPTQSRPREKMLEQGAAALTVQELLAVVLATGTKKEDLSEMSHRIIKEYGQKNIMSETDASLVSSKYQIPLFKACQIVACAELGRRFYKKPETGLAIIRTPEDVFAYAHDMRELPKEHLRGIYLDTHNRVIHDEYISIGTINSNLVHPREVFRVAVEYNAAAVVLVHNHPSGIVTPSDADIAITKQLISAGKIIGIHILDHVIVTKDHFQSIETEYE